MKVEKILFLLFYCFAYVGLCELKLTDLEKNWLTEHPIINIANEDDWPPFDYSQKGKALGLTISYTDLISKKLGIQFNYINGYSWDELFNK